MTHDELRSIAERHDTRMAKAMLKALDEAGGRGEAR